MRNNDVYHRPLRHSVFAAATVLSTASGVWALDLDLAFDGMLVRADPAREGAYDIATAPWTGAEVPTQTIRGVVQRYTWQIPQSGGVERLVPQVEDALIAQGYEITFHCQDRDCGGFDFRYAVDVGNAPDMHVDLGDFVYLTATRPGSDGPTIVAAMLSQGGTTGYAHIARIGAEAAAPVTPSTRRPDPVAAPGFDGAAGSLAARLDQSGMAVLEDLQFETGASSLSGRDYASLRALAEYLTGNPDREVVLVGHTDAQGALAGNIALSEARATAVRDHLVTELGVDAGQVSAEGIGFLAPRASNATTEGRQANRRVEVVLTTP